MLRSFVIKSRPWFGWTEKWHVSKLGDCWPNRFDNVNHRVMYIRIGEIMETHSVGMCYGNIRFSVLLDWHSVAGVTNIWPKSLVIKQFLNKRSYSMRLSRFPYFFAPGLALYVNLDILRSTITVKNWWWNFACAVGKLSQENRRRWNRKLLVYQKKSCNDTIVLILLYLWAIRNS